MLGAILRVYSYIFHLLISVALLALSVEIGLGFVERRLFGERT